MIKKLKFYKNLLIELIETLCTILLYMEDDSMNPYLRRHRCDIHGHFKVLKIYSEELKGE